MDIESLLRPIDEGEPSGENLEYEMIFTEMELASQYGEESQMGDSVIDAEPPDFAELSQAALSVLAKSHDLRAAVFAAEAGLARQGVTDFAEGLELVVGYLQQFWDTCHPQPDEDDGDVTMRINAVAALADNNRIIKILRRSGLTQSRVFGKLSLRDVDIADGKAAAGPDDPGLDVSSVSAAFQDTDEEKMQEITTAIRRAQEAVKEIDAAFAEYTPGEGPTLDPLIDTLRAMDVACRRFGSGDSDGEDVSAAGTDAGAGPVRSMGGGGAPGAINGPDDVVAALDRVMAYYATFEPSSPLPILLGRAKRLVRADFLTIVKDMANDGYDEVRRIGGLPDDDDD